MQGGGVSTIIATITIQLLILEDSKKETLLCYNYFLIFNFQNVLGMFC